MEAAIQLDNTESYGVQHLVHLARVVRLQADSHGQLIAS